MHAMMLLFSQGQLNELTTHTKFRPTLSTIDDGEELPLFTDLLTRKLKESESIGENETASKQQVNKLGVIEDLRMALLQLDKETVLEFDMQLEKGLTTELKERMTELETLSKAEIVDNLLVKLNLSKLSTDEINSIVNHFKEFIVRKSKEDRTFPKDEISSLPRDKDAQFIPVDDVPSSHQAKETVHIPKSEEVPRNGPDKEVTFAPKNENVLSDDQAKEAVFIPKNEEIPPRDQAKSLAYTPKDDEVPTNDQEKEMVRISKDEEVSLTASDKEAPYIPKGDEVLPNDHAHEAPFIPKDEQLTPNQQTTESLFILKDKEVPSIHLELERRSYFPINNQKPNRHLLVGKEDDSFSFNHVEELLAQINTKEDIKRVAPKLLHALIQWNQLTDKNARVVPNSTTSLIGDKQTEHIWQELLQRYQQKMNFHSKNIYTLDSKVSNSDVIRWLSKILGASVHNEKEGMTPTQIKAPMPMEKVEQFIIQLPMKSETQTTERSLLEQFQRLVDGNRPILMQPKGQLAITLKPANLGEMLVRFTQVDGETMVKILVTTTTAKEMLEGNIKQLRHMFAPHQVTIEKQEITTEQTTETQKEEHQDEEEERQEENLPENDKSKEDNPTESFSSVFEELILNEKV